MAKKGARTIKPVERKIFFYQMSTNSNLWTPDTTAVDLEGVFKYIEALPFDSSLAGSRYWADRTNGTFLSIHIDSLEMPFRVRFVKTRRMYLPQVEERGNFSTISLSQEAGIAEQMHLVVFTDGIMGAEYNFHGPRIERFIPYILGKASHIYPQLACRVLLKPQGVERLRKVKDLQYFRLRFRASYLAQVEQAGLDLGNAFDAAATAGDMGEVDIVLRAKPKSGRFLNNKLLPILQRVIERNDAHGNILDAEAQGIDEESEMPSFVDLLSEHFLTKAAIPLLSHRSRVIDSTMMYSAIESAYVEYKPDLKKAAGVIL